MEQHNQPWLNIKSRFIIFIWYLKFLHNFCGLWLFHLCQYSKHTLTPTCILNVRGQVFFYLWKLLCSTEKCCSVFITSLKHLFFLFPVPLTHDFRILHLWPAAWLLVSSKLHITVNVSQVVNEHKPFTELIFTNELNI